MKTSFRERSESGQVLVIVAVGLLAMVAMVGLVIDGGHAWGQQRDTQNGIDAAAEAGALRLSENLPWIAVGQPRPNQNSDVAAAVTAAATANDVELEEAWYVDWSGNRVGGAPLIGDGALAGGIDPPADADGVEALGFKDFDTFLGQIVGITEMTAKADATARAGYINSPGRSSILPVVFPLNITSCTNTNNPDSSEIIWPTGVDQIVPLCRSGPGNVGWLDWTPPAGGTSELVDQILEPDVPFDVTTPGWYFVAETGNVSAQQVQNALMTYAPGNQVVYIPLFDATCSSQPPNPAADACTTGSGNGQNQYYHLAGWTSWDIEWVDLNGGRSVCGSGNGSTGCFKGQFVGIHGIPSGTLREAGANENVLFLTGIELVD